jgi:hypothetical protein
MTSFICVTRRFAALAIVVGAAALVPAHTAAQEAIQMSGEVVDLSCYLHKGSKGASHRACAKMCAKKGLPIGLLSESGEVFLLIEDHDDPDPYDDLKKMAGYDAEVSGKKYSRGGMTSIMVKEAKKP